MLILMVVYFLEIINVMLTLMPNIWMFEGSVIALLGIIFLYLLEEK